jgi:hypothetical protein
MVSLGRFVNYYKIPLFLRKFNGIYDSAGHGVHGAQRDEELHGHVSRVDIDDMAVIGLHDFAGFVVNFHNHVGFGVVQLNGTAALDKEAEKLNDEVVSVYELILQSIEQNARVAQNQDDYNRRAAKLEKQYAAAKARLDAIAAEKQERTVRRERLNRFLDDLRRQDAFLTEFDPALFRATVDKITVYTEQDIAVTFRDGSELHVSVLGK